MDVVGMAGSASFADRHLTSSSREVAASTEVLWSLRLPFWRQAAVPLIKLTIPTLFAALPGSKGRLKSRRLAGGWRAGVSSKISDVGTLSPPVTDENVASEDDHYECVIVGGGISGLCTAQALATRHAKEVGGRILVSESRPRVGGNITTVEGDGYLWEEGPNSFQPNDSMLSMVVDSGLKEELVLGDPNAPRFVFWNGKLRPVPAGPGDLPFFDLMSIFGKIRAGLGALGLKSPNPGREESVEEFVRRNLGDEVFERLIEPFCSGVYAGDPAKLSMKAAFGKVWKLEQLGGSIIAGTLKMLNERRKNPPPPRDQRLPKIEGQTVGSFQKGLITLPKGIATGLGDKVKTSWKLVGIQKSSMGEYLLTYDTPEGTKQVSTKVVVLTVPAYVASELLSTLCQSAANALLQVHYPPVAAVTISYPKTSIREECLIDGQLKGFGQLHPRSQGIQTLGTIYSSSLFPGRAPEDRVLLLNYIGGATYPQITSMEEADIVDIVDKDIRKMLVRPDSPPPSVLGVRIWKQAIPQFTVGHLDVLENIKHSMKESGLEGIFLGGNYVAGVSLGRCVEYAYESAQEVASFMKQKLSV